MKKINKLYRYSKQLKQPHINKFVSELLEGYELESINQNDRHNVICRFINDEKETIVLTAYDEVLLFEKNGNTKKEIIDIYSKEPYILRYVCEKRPKGMIIVESKERYSYTKYSNKEMKLIDLHEYRYAFNNDNLRFIYDNITPIQFEHINPGNITLINYNKAAFYTRFSVKMQHIKSFSDNMGFIFITPLEVYIDDKNVSYFYDLKDGDDKVKRAHDLYNGIINETNQRDIKDIRLGKLHSDGFDLKSFTGITEKENAFIGDPLEGPSLSYQENVKKILEEVCSYTGEVLYDRESLLNYIENTDMYIENIGNQTKKFILNTEKESKS